MAHKQDNFCIMFNRIKAEEAQEDSKVLPSVQIIILFLDDN